MLLSPRVMEGALVRGGSAPRTRDRVREVVMVNMCVLFPSPSVLVLFDAPRIAITSLVGIGAMNSIIRARREVSIPLTYMTGTLVKMGQRFVDALFVVPTPLAENLRMWAGLTSAPSPARSSTATWASSPST